MNNYNNRGSFDLLVILFTVLFFIFTLFNFFHEMNNGSDSDIQHPALCEVIYVNDTNIWLPDAIENTYSDNCLLKADILLEDGTVIYESGFLVPMEVVQTVETTIDLQSGVYQHCTLLYRYYYKDDTSTAVRQYRYPAQVCCF